MHANECKCALQLKQKMQNSEPPRAVQHAHREGILAEMTALKEELLADNVEPIGIKLYTDDPELKELLSDGDGSQASWLRHAARWQAAVRPAHGLACIHCMPLQVAMS